MTFQLRLSDQQICDGIIFDLDGTLWDTTVVISRIWTKEFGREIPIDTIRSCMGKTADEISQRIGVTPEQLAAVQSMENDYLWRRGGRVYPNVFPLLRSLYLRTIPCFIVSNCQAGYAECFVHHHCVDRYFQSWRTSATGAKAANIRSILTAYGLSCPVVIGDTESDYKAATENQLPMLQAWYGFGEPLPNVTGIADIGDLVKLIT
jgi:phosphoglycolate phosphatase